MTRTEADLRAVYIDSPGIAAVERRLIDSIRHGELVATGTPGRTPLKKWAAAGASAAAVVTVTATMAVLAAHQDSHNQAGAPAPSTSLVSSPTNLAPAEVPITPQVAVQTLIDLLPRKGAVSHLFGGTTLGWAGGGFVYDDGHGAAQLTVGVTYPYRYNGSLQRRPAGSLCNDQAIKQSGDSCTTVSDGSQVASYQGNANIPNGAKDWEVMLLRADGVEIDITEWNSPGEKGGVQTRSDPPFTITELTSIAHSDAWQASVSAAEAAHDASLFVAGTTGPSVARGTSAAPLK